MMPGGFTPQRVAGDCLAARTMCAHCGAVANTAVPEDSDEKNRNNVFRESIRKLRYEIEHSGKKVFLTEGEYDNIKITRPIDMIIAERILEERSALKQL